MRWSIEAGKKKRRQPTADQLALLASKPELDAGGFMLARAYAETSTERHWPAGPIPISEVRGWEDRHGITDPRVRAHVEAVITAIDAITLRRANRPPPKPDGESKRVGLQFPNRRRRK